MFNFIIVYKLDPPVPKGDLYTEKSVETVYTKTTMIRLDEF